jgi:hypothetical protein
MCFLAKEVPGDFSTSSTGAQRQSGERRKYYKKIIKS